MDWQRVTIQNLAAELPGGVKSGYTRCSDSMDKWYVDRLFETMDQPHTVSNAMDTRCVVLHSIGWTGQNRTDICHGIANKSHSTQWSGGVALSKEQKWNGPTLIEFVPNWTRWDINSIEADGLHLDHLFETMEELGLVSNAMESSNVVVQNAELERPIYSLIDIMR